MTPPEPAPLAHRTDLPERSEAEQLAFFDAMHEAWCAAANRAAGQTAYFELAGIPVAIEFAGSALADAFLPALAHLRLGAEGVEPRFVLRCWDEQTTGVSVPPAPCAPSAFTDRGDLWGMTSARVRSAFHFHDHSVNVFDVSRGVGVFWVRDAARLPYWSRASPLRTLLHWCAEATGGQLLHAAAVGDRDGAVLVTGRGGVGKSSTALACLAAGMDYVGDDYVVVRMAPEPTVYSLYATAKLDPEQLAHFPSLAAHAVGRPAAAGDKAVLQLVPAFAPQVVRARKLRAIVTPAFADVDETTVGPASPAALQRAATFTTLAQLPGAGRGTHAFIERMIARLPGFTLRLGRDRARVPDVIGALLALGDDELCARAAAEGTSAGAAGRRGRPVVSVVIPVYNGAAFLPQCVEHVLAQDYAPLEILVVDDGSHDGVDRVAHALPVDVRYIRQTNAGPAAARNRGIREAAGDVLAFLDVDDYWPPGHLATMVDRLADDPDALVAHGAAQVVRAGVAGAPDEYIGGPADAFADYIGAGVYRREAFARVGMFDPELRFGEDSDWFGRARELGVRMINVDEIALYVRRHEGNTTRGKTLADVELLRVLKKALDRRQGVGQPRG